MNFNPMDLIKTREYFEVSMSEQDNDAIKRFISLLLDVQAKGMNEMDIILKETLGDTFEAKQDLIEMAFKLGNTLN